VLRQLLQVSVPLNDGRIPHFRGVRVALGRATIVLEGLGGRRGNGVELISHPKYLCDRNQPIRSRAVSRRPPISLSRIVARTYTHDAKVWDLSIAQGPVSVAPCQTLMSRFATVCIAVRRPIGWTNTHRFERGFLSAIGCGGSQMRVLREPHSRAGLHPVQGRAGAHRAGRR
jgi:hypothetical protein